MEAGNLSHLEEDVPAVIRGKLKEWTVVNYTKEDWCKVFKNRLLKFRQGKKVFSWSPYWEHLCENKEITLNDFFELSTSDSNHWLYFDYKYLKDVFPDGETFIKEIKWSDLKLFSFESEEAALWIGNEGAHTPCHKDTYGCNLVVQLFGRKLWILMPPNETERLAAVRVPYEESSVYSSCNFYTPNNNLLRIENAYKVILSPGDVLYVPRHWWHYVENLEPAISINVWLPLTEDYESRLEESLVQLYVSSICQNLTDEESKQILNPNEYSLRTKPCTIDTVEKCLENYRKHEKDSSNNVRDRINKLSGEKNKLDKLNAQSYISEKSEIHKYNLFLKQKSEGEVEKSSRVSLARALINAYCHPSNITAVKTSLLKS